jgi:hypothetical protein
MLGSMRTGDEILRQQNQLRDSFLSVAPLKWFEPKIGHAQQLSSLEQNGDTRSRQIHHIHSGTEKVLPQLVQHNQFNNYMKATVNQLDSQGRIPPQTYFKQFDVQKLDRSVNDGLKLKQALSSDTTSHENQIYKELLTRNQGQSFRGSLVRLSDVGLNQPSQFQRPLYQGALSIIGN